MSLSFLFKLQHWQKYDYTDFISTLLHNLETLNLIIIHFKKMPFLQFYTQTICCIIYKTLIWW